MNVSEKIYSGIFRKIYEKISIFQNFDSLDIMFTGTQSAIQDAQYPDKDINIEVLGIL